MAIWNLLCDVDSRTGGILLPVVACALVVLLTVTTEADVQTVKRNVVVHPVGVTHGENAHLPCHVDFQLVDSGVKVEWFDPNGAQMTSNRVSMDPRFHVENRYVSEYMLTIDEIREDEAGVYECRIIGLLNHNMTSVKQVQLIVNSPPTFTFKTPDTQVRAGSDVMLSCIASGSPAPVVMWSLPLQSGSAREILFKGEKMKLVSVRPRDAGWYSCTADNNIQPPAVERIHLDVLFAPELTIPYKEVHQDLGSSATLQCVVISNPKRDLYWSRDDGTRLDITNSKYHIRESTSSEEYSHVLSLEFLKLEASQFTDYKCTAKNDYGDAVAVVTLVEFNNTRGPPVTGEDKMGSTTQCDASMPLVAVLATALAVTLVALVIALYCLVQKTKKASACQNKNDTSLYIKCDSYNKNGSSVNQAEQQDELKDMLS